MAEEEYVLMEDGHITWEEEVPEEEEGSDEESVILVEELPGDSDEETVVQETVYPLGHPMNPVLISDDEEED